LYVYYSSNEAKLFAWFGSIRSRNIHTTEIILREKLRVCGGGVGGWVRAPAMGLDVVSVPFGCNKHFH
jgi:hypothetical protein